MIHYFNPGNETAILNGSKYYQPANNQLKMQEELAFLPAWYANPNDFIFVKNNFSIDFLQKLNQLKPIAQAITLSDFIHKKEKWNQQEVCFWGIAPNVIHLFEKINQEYNLDIQIPEWETELKELSSRYSSHFILGKLIHAIPKIEKDILPVFFYSIDDLEKQVISSQYKSVVKSPYSSSGRGLSWLPPKQLAQSERQIIGGMLKKQKTVSLEKALDKIFDFSAHFEISKNKTIHFIGYSLFETNNKGAYEKSLLFSQKEIEEKIRSFIDKTLIFDTINRLKKLLQERYSGFYSGNIGVDMMIYQSENTYKLHPCVEINMRKSMGYLAMQLQKNHIRDDSFGYFSIEYNKSSQDTYKQHIEMSNQFPLITENGLIKSGYLNLCPVTEDSNYHAYIKIKSRIK